MGGPMTQMATGSESSLSDDGPDVRRAASFSRRAGLTSDRISLAATMEREGERERERDMAVDELHTWDVEGDTDFLTREAR
jgi:hypothetical protein